MFRLVRVIRSYSALIPQVGHFGSLQRIIFDMRVILLGHAVCRDPYLRIERAEDTMRTYSTGVKA